MSKDAFVVLPKVTRYDVRSHLVSLAVPSLPGATAASPGLF